MKSQQALIELLKNRLVSDVIADLRCSNAQMRKWLLGEHKIYTKWARKFAVYFNVGPEIFIEEWYTTSEDDLLKRRRLRLGFSLVEMSAHTGYCEKTLWNWENGHLPEKKRMFVETVYTTVENKINGMPIKGA